MLHSMILLMLSNVDRGNTGDKNKNKEESSKANKRIKNNGIIKIIKHISISNIKNCLAIPKHPGDKIANKLEVLSQNDRKKYESSLFWEYLSNPHIIYIEIKQNSNYCTHASDIMNHLSFNSQTYGQLFVKSTIHHIGECGTHSLELPYASIPGDTEDVYDGDIDNGFYDIHSLQCYIYLQTLALEMTVVPAVLVVIMVIIWIKEIVIQVKRIPERTANKICSHGDLNVY